MKKTEIKNILNTISEEDYKSTVDLHVHTNESDGKMSPKKVMEEARKKDLKYISITDHNTIDAYLKTNILTEEILIPGVEFDCYFKGNIIHILGYGIDIDNLEIRSLYSEGMPGRTFNLYRLFKLRNPEEVIKKIKEAGGIAVLAHPCCYWTKNLDNFVRDLICFGLEGIEVYYPYRGLRRIVKFHSRETVKKIADKYTLIKTGGSDCHKGRL